MFINEHGKCRLYLIGYTKYISIKFYLFTFADSSQNFIYTGQYNIYNKYRTI